jgi:hypothetical protein
MLPDPRASTHGFMKRQLGNSTAWATTLHEFVMPAPVAGIRVFISGQRVRKEDVDARHKAGHDENYFAFGSTGGSTRCGAPALRTWIVAISSL